MAVFAADEKNSFLDIAGSKGNISALGEKTERRL
jgi:hypothetical protein